MQLEPNVEQYVGCRNLSRATTSRLTQRGTRFFLFAALGDMRGVPVSSSFQGPFVVASHSVMRDAHLPWLPKAQVRGHPVQKLAVYLQLIRARRLVAKVFLDDAR